MLVSMYICKEICVRLRMFSILSSCCGYVCEHAHKCTIYIYIHMCVHVYAWVFYHHTRSINANMRVRVRDLTVCHQHIRLVQKSILTRYKAYVHEHMHIQVLLLPRAQSSTPPTGPKDRNKTHLFYHIYMCVTSPHQRLQLVQKIKSTLISSYMYTYV
jgi:hypothetical protein